MVGGRRAVTLELKRNGSGVSAVLMKRPREREAPVKLIGTKVCSIRLARVRKLTGGIYPPAFRGRAMCMGAKVLIVKTSPKAKRRVITSSIQ